MALHHALRNLGWFVSALALSSASGCAAQVDEDDEENVDEDLYDDSQALGLAGGLFNGGEFILAADYQPVSTFGAWKWRHINTLIRSPEPAAGAWTAEATRQGFKIIRGPSTNPADDTADKLTNLIAWHWTDEPELHSESAATIDSLAAVRAVKPLPVQVNFFGGSLLNAKNGCYTNGAKYRTCFGDFIGRADWISQDLYTCAGGNCNVGRVGDAMNTLRRWSNPTKALFAYVEVSDADGKKNALPFRPNHVRSQVWEAILQGARGVFYFPVGTIPVGKAGCPGPVPCGDPKRPDTTEYPRDLTELNELLLSIGPALQGPVNPKGFAIKAPKPLDIGWRKDPQGNHYFIVVNPTNRKLAGQRMNLAKEKGRKAEVLGEKRTEPVNRDGLLVDDFAPFETHVYRVKH